VLGASTRSRSRPKIFSGSQPKKNTRLRTKHGRDRNLTTRSKILCCFHQDVYPGKFSKKFLGRDPENFSGHDRNFFLGRDLFLNFGVDGPQHYENGPIRYLKALKEGPFDRTK
jgi:hypothetical protein